MYLNGEIVQVCSSDYIIIVQKLNINLELFAQHKAVPCISLLLQNYRQSHGTAMGTKMAVAFVNNYLRGKIKRAILRQSNKTPIFWKIFIDDIISIRGTQRIGTVKYLFERPLIPSYFLKKIVTSNVRDMPRSSMSVVFGLLKMPFWAPKKKASYHFRKGDKT